MILHLTPGSGTVELHVHDGAQVALYQPGDRPVPVQADPATKPHTGPRWLVLGLTGAVCLALGYGAALRGSGTPTAIAAAPVRAVASLPGNIPLVPQAAPPARGDVPGIALPPVRPQAGAGPADGVPAALAQQLAQSPVVVAPAAPTRPAAPGGSAFGLEN